MRSIENVIPTFEDKMLILINVAHHNCAAIISSTYCNYAEDIRFVLYEFSLVDPSRCKIMHIRNARTGDLGSDGRDILHKLHRHRYQIFDGERS